MKILLTLFASSLLLLVGCAGNVTTHEQHKLTINEKNEAITDFKEQGGSILFSLLLNREGEIVDLDVVDWDKKQTNLFTAARLGRKLPSSMKFTQAYADDPDIRRITHIMDIKNSVSLY